MTDTAMRLCWANLVGQTLWVTTPQEYTQYRVASVEAAGVWFEGSAEAGPETLVFLPFGKFSAALSVIGPRTRADD